MPAVRRPIRRRVALGALAAGIAAGVLPASASALTAVSTGAGVRLEALGLERNSIQIFFAGPARIEITELKADGPKLFGLGGKCDRPGGIGGNPRRLVCTDVSALKVLGSLGPGDDTLTVIATGETDISGDLGDDTMSGGPGHDRLTGGGGAISGDVLNGAAGDDEILAGVTTVLNAGIRANGGPGSDRIVGGNGPDILQGDEGDDAILGKDQRDTLVGGAGKDTLEGGGNDDDIFADDGEADVINCDGAQSNSDAVGFNDDARVDLVDIPSANRTADRFGAFSFGGCETVLAAPFGLQPTVRIAPASIAVGARAVRARLTCPKVLSGPCAGTVRAAVSRRAGRNPRFADIARLDYSIAPGASRVLRLPLEPAAKARLKTAKRLRVIAVEPGNELGPKTSFVTVSL